MIDLMQQGRILYVSMADVSQPNGPGVNEREFLLSLYEQLGDRMHAVLPAPGRHCEEIDRSRTTMYRNPNRWDLLGYLRQQFELYRVVKQLTKTGDFDLVVARLSLLPIAFWFWSRLNFPFAVKTLGAVQGFTKSKGLKGWVAKTLGPLNGWLFRRIIARALAVDCCTETHFREHLKDYRLLDDRLQVVENATNVSRFSPREAEVAKQTLGLSRFSPILGFVGGSPADRGGEQMLTIASSLLADYPNLGVVIVGNDQGNVLQQRAKELGLEDRVILPGLVAYENIPEYVTSFDVGYALDRPERMVKTGNSYQKVRQYLACGKPVVTCVEPTSALRQQALVESVHPDDMENLLLATRRLLQRNSQERAEHTVRAPKFIQERLSTQFTLTRRLAFWSQRLQAAHTSPTRIQLSPAE